MAVYPWETACAEAGSETNRTLMRSRIIAARSDIYKRLNEIGPISLEEKVKIKNALAQLTKLERERAD
jgi:hypothetical protein